MNRARTALRDAAAVLGADQPEVIAKHPQKWCRLVNIVDDVLVAVDGEAHKGRVM